MTAPKPPDACLRVGRILERSHANGPGERFVIWVQGCALACPGCFNPGLWNKAGGTDIPVKMLAERINSAHGIRGLTISGGEPLDQAQAVGKLLRLLDPRLDSVVFSGYSWEEIEADPIKSAALRQADLLIAGRYMRERASEENPWAGSSNKTVHALSGRIRCEEFPSCRVEAHIRPDGSATLTGFPDTGLTAISRANTLQSIQDRHET